ncbi:MAG: glycosyltransferase family 9 protein [Candidatus Omnitrophota bacterium]|jgi:ADP-heptose:LPS heptosyltransferase
MGYGGSLIWTAVIGELSRRYPGRSVLFKHTIPTPLERCAPAGLKQNPVFRKVNKRLFWETKPLDEIFMNNPHLVQANTLARGQRKKAIIIDCNANENSYAVSCTKEKIVFKTGNAIAMLCKRFGCEGASLPRPELYFTEEEQQRVARWIEGIADFIALEPHAKDDYTPNKSWLFERWQAVVDQVSGLITVVQVGLPGKALLKGVKDFRGLGSFRETACLLGHARLFAGTDSGLMHAARAVGTDSVILYGGYTPIELTAYSNNVNIYHHVACAPCGLRTECPFHKKCLASIRVEEVVAAITGKLKLTAPRPDPPAVSLT